MLRDASCLVCRELFVFFHLVGSVLKPANCAPVVADRVTFDPAMRGDPKCSALYGSASRELVPGQTSCRCCERRRSDGVSFRGALVSMIYVWISWSSSAVSMLADTGRFAPASSPGSCAAMMS